MTTLICLDDIGKIGDMDEIKIKNYMIVNSEMINEIIRNVRVEKIYIGDKSKIRKRNIEVRDIKELEKIDRKIYDEKEGEIKIECVKDIRKIRDYYIEYRDINKIREITNYSIDYIKNILETYYYGLIIENKDNKDNMDNKDNIENNIILRSGKRIRRG
jgi:hypothetical protein